MSAKPALTARGISRSYGTATIVDDVDLTLTPGRVVALLGPSGAGKSTLLRLLAGLETLDTGEIAIGNRVLSRPGSTVPAEKRRTGLIFQDFALFPHMTAQENVRFGLADRPREEGRRQALGWLARLGLETRASAYPHQLSGGEQQRVAIARALAPGPDAILMDEPFSGLDPALRGEVAEIALAAIREAGLPALLVSHDAAAAMEAADDLAIMRAGKIVQTGTPAEIYRHPADSLVASALGPTQTFRARDLPAALCPHAASPDDLVTIRSEAVRLDPASPVHARITRHACLGASDRLWLDVDGLELVATVTGEDVAEAGDTVAISLDPGATFVFAPHAPRSGP